MSKTRTARSEEIQGRPHPFQIALGRGVGLLLAAAATTLLHAETITVCLDGSCDHTSVQAAIDAASNGDVIEVSGETYLLETTIDTDGKAVTIRGTADPKTGNPNTVLDGQGAHRVLQCISGEGPDTVFDDLVIRNGYTGGDGGGMYNSSSSPTIRDCTFTGNSAANGGALYNFQGSNPTLTECSFISNSADYGGGIYDWNDAGTTLLTSCSFVTNSANNDAGAAYCRGNGTVRILNSTFHANRSTSDSGNPQVNAGAVWFDGPLEIEDSTFTENFSRNYGGALYGNPTSGDPAPVLTLTGCQFTGNVGPEFGGALILFGVEASITNCHFENNSGLYGTAICATYGNFYENDTTTTIENCTFNGNASESTDGDGAVVLFINNANSVIESCTFTSNLGCAVSATQNISEDDYTLHLRNSVIQNNTVGDGATAGLFVANVSYVALLENNEICGNTPIQITGPWTNVGGNCILSECDETACASQQLTVCPDGSCQFTDIQSAILAATPFDVIEIAAGTYLINEPLSTIGQEVVLRGEVDEDGLPLTILDGQGLHQIVRCEESEGYSTIFENLVLRNGTADQGGALLIQNASPTFTNCTFEASAATSGGAAFLNEGAPTFSNCRFESNIADDGGGLYVLIGQPEFIDCSFTSNTATDDGGALFARNQASTLELRSCTFDANQAGDRGGAVKVSSVTCLADDSLFQNNLSGGYGAAVDLTGGTFDLSASTLTGNSSDSRGGGIHFGFFATGVIQGCTFDQNSGAFGGAVSCERSDPEFLDCTFTSNTSSLEGGGAYLEDSAPRFTNCSLQANVASEFGGGIRSYLGSAPILGNSEVCGNTPDQIAGPWTDEGGSCVLSTCGADSDGDQVNDCVDGCPDDPEKTEPGACGCGVAETDSDDDATPDCIDGCPEDSDKTEPGLCGCGTADDDRDDDGTVDCFDQCPEDPLKIEPGLCGCGVSDDDSDLDGTVDCQDGCPADPDKTEPGACGCGASDADSDRDGTPDCLDGCPADPEKTEPGLCGCGVSELDSDADATPDCLDDCPDDPNKIEPGACGCGVPDTDTDDDATPDCLDDCPNDPLKIEPGTCGCGTPDTDTDDDGVADCLDDCPGEPDTDTDEDGTPDCIDPCPLWPGGCSEDGQTLVVTPEDDLAAAITLVPEAGTVQLTQGVFAPGTPINPQGKAFTLRGIVASSGALVSSISGQGSHPVLICTSGEGADSIFRDLVITEGLGEVGGGMTIQGSQPTVTNCTFVGNAADYGGGLGIRIAAAPSVTNCRFEGNSAVYRGGGSSTLNGSQPTFSNCTFQGNTAGYWGGGLWSGSDSQTQLTDCTFIANTAVNDGGGLVNSDGSNTVLDTCHFESNTSGNDGGGIANIGQVELSLTGCSFIANQSAEDGGGLYNDGGTCALTACDFDGNIAASRGGGTFTLDADLISTFCTFTNNTANTGGAVASAGTGSTLLGASTICSNTLDQIDGNWTDLGSNCIMELCTQDADGDEVVDCEDGCPDDPEKTEPGLCGCGTPDTDTDQDGTPDCTDGCPNDSDKTEPGLCGCGTPDTDADQDGTPDCIDGCPADPEKTAPGQCGCGTPDTDTDGDGAADCIDDCPTWVGDCLEDGTLIVTPSESIQHAIDVAPDGGVVALTAGTFTPSSTLDLAGRALTIRGSIDDVGTPASIMDGGGTRRVLIINNGETATTILESLVLQNGDADEEEGGALLIEDTSPTLTNCRFIANRALFGGAISVRGGQPTLTDCRFEANEAQEGGGAIYAFGGAPILINCTLTDNEATVGFGGAILGYLGSSIELSSSTVVANRSGATGGGLYATNSSQLTLAGTIVCGNTPDQIIGPLETDETTCIQSTCFDCDLIDCPADLNGDGTVDGADLTLLLADWGCVGAGCVGDFDGNGAVNGADLTIILSAWGDCE